jgi:hypothetical protein
MMEKTRSFGLKFPCAWGTKRSRQKLSNHKLLKDDAMQTRKTNEATEAPEALNREQQDDAQVIDAMDMLRSGETRAIGVSVHGRENDPADVIADDVPDLIDRMEEMVRTGHIDNDAFAGEPVHDDDEDMLGDALARLDDDGARP